MRNGNTIDTLTSVHIQESVKTGRKVIESYEGVINRGKFKILPLKKRYRKTVCTEKKNRDEKNDLMQGLVKIIMNSIYGVQI